MGEVNYRETLQAAWDSHLKARTQNAPTVISTFAGCGGSSLGYSMAGYRELLAVEWNGNAIDTFKTNFPDVPVHHGDIAKLSVEDVMSRCNLKRGQLDVLDGSPPCQGFSTAGKRNIDDPRNSLFREYCRLIEGLQPKVIVMENVSGMVKGKMKLVFVEILRHMEEIGYQVSARLMDAAYFGVPQHRQRMIFIGTRNDLNVELTHPAPQSKPIPLWKVLDDCSPCQQAESLSNVKLLRWMETKPGRSHAARFSLLRLSWTKTPGTILKMPGSGGHLHPDKSRLLHIGELKRIASFPDAFEFAGSWSDAVSRIGNSVPPLFMRAIAQHIRDTILTDFAKFETDVPPKATAKPAKPTKRAKK